MTSFQATVSAKAWKEKLSALQNAEINTFEFVATRDQLQQLDAAYDGDSVTVELRVGPQGELGCADTSCANSEFGTSSNCRAQFHAAKHALVHAKAAKAAAEKAAREQSKLALKGRSNQLVQSKFTKVDSPAPREALLEPSDENLRTGTAIADAASTPTSALVCRVVRMSLTSLVHT